LTSLLVVILCFMVRKITAEDAEELRAFNHLSPPPRLSTHFAVKFSVWLRYALVPGSLYIVKFHDGGLCTCIVTLLLH